MSSAPDRAAAVTAAARDELATAPVSVGSAAHDAAIARPMVAVDTVLFALESRGLKCYLARLAGGPAAGRWAFAGGLVRVGETLDEAARRELRDAAGLDEAYLEQLFSFGDPSRDPTAHVVSVAYMALIDDPRRVGAASAKYRGGRWFAARELPELAYDHALMAEYALGRLRAKLEYTNIACTMLPATFTFAELEELYAAVLERPLDRRNFRRRIMAMDLLRRMPEQRRGAHRPAALYAFKHRSVGAIQML